MSCLTIWLLTLGATPCFMGARVTPIGKVLQMMDGMVVQGRQEKEAEAVRFSAFSQWCGDQTRIKNDEIKAGTDKIDALQAEIEKHAAAIRAQTDRIEELEEDVNRWKKDQKSAQTVRDQETLDFKATNMDYSESLIALGQAITVLKKQAYNRPQAEAADALLQLRRQRLVPDAAKMALKAALFQEDPDKQLFYDAPEANAYDFQSSGVVDMLEKLSAEFEGKKYELEKEELQSKNAFQQLMQQLADNVENADHEAAQKREQRGRTEQAKSEAEGELAQTKSDREADEKYLEGMTALCNLKKTDFENRQQLRTEELEALEKAIEIIGGGAVAGAAEKHLPSFLQTAMSLAHLRSDEQSPLQAQVAAFLSERARSTGSSLLSSLSEQAARGPFDKVKKMIKDLISKLMQEATAETEHKGWCDSELVANKITRDRKTKEVERLMAEVDDLTAAISDLTQDIADLAAAVKELDASMASASADRTSSAAKNEQTIKEAKEAQEAVSAAMAVLKDFYAKSAQATALAQQTPLDDAPETFDKEYKGMLTEGGGVMDFLEVILSDFARLDSETVAAEAMEADEFKEFMFQAKKDKALKEGESNHKAETKTAKESALRSATNDLKTTHEQLDKAVAYFEKLKPTCVDSGISYEERVKRREEEIQSLQEALKILKGEDIAF